MSAGGMEVLDPVHSYRLFQQKKLFTDIRNFFDFCAVGQRTNRLSWSPCYDRGSWYERCRVSSGQRSVTGGNWYEQCSVSSGQRSATGGSWYEQCRVSSGQRSVTGVGGINNAGCRQANDLWQGVSGMNSAGCHQTSDLYWPAQSSPNTDKEDLFVVVTGRKETESICRENLRFCEHESNLQQTR